MAKLNLEMLKEKLNLIDSKKDNKSTALKELLISAGNSSIDNTLIDGTLSQEVSAKIESKINNLVTGFQSQKGFNWQLHILEPIGSLVDVIKLVDQDLTNRPQLEAITVDLIQNLFKRYPVKIPVAWIPKFVSDMILSVIVNTLTPKLVDWIFDRIYGPDED